MFVNYAFGRTVLLTHDRVVVCLTAALASERLRVLTEIDVAATLKKKGLFGILLFGVLFDAMIRFGVWAPFYNFFAARSAA